MRLEKDPNYICEMTSGIVYLCNMQFLPGYCIFLAQPTCPSINSINQEKRKRFLIEMTIIGDAVMEVTGAYQINYALMGNSDPVLHAHIVPRYLSEPTNLRKGLPWSYPNMDDEEYIFNQRRDKDLIQKIETSIQRRMNSVFIG